MRLTLLAAARAPPALLCPGQMHVQLHDGAPVCLKSILRVEIGGRERQGVLVGFRLSFHFLTSIFSSQLPILLATGPTPDTEAIVLHRLFNQDP